MLAGCVADLTHYMRNPSVLILKVERPTLLETRRKGHLVYVAVVAPDSSGQAACLLFFSTLEVSRSTGRDISFSRDFFNGINIAETAIRNISTVCM